MKTHACGNGGGRMDLLMGVDIGSTNTKAVVFDPEGNVVSEGSAETRLSHDRTHPT